MSRDATPSRADADLRARRKLLERLSDAPSIETQFDGVLDLKPHETLLDVGCGGGGFLGRLRSGGHPGRVVGVDVASALVELATRHHPGIEFRQADILDLPSDLGAFDVVTARYVLDHLPDLGQGLDAICRVLVSGGRGVFIANAFGHLGGFWAAVAEATRGDEALAPLWDEPSGDPRREERLMAVAELRFASVGLRYLSCSIAFEHAAQVLSLFDTYRQSYAGIPDAAWCSARAALERRLPSSAGGTPWRVELRAAVVTVTKG